MSPDPDAAEWREVAADLGALAEERVRAAFEWVGAELGTSGSRGAVVLMLALSDMDHGRPLPRVLADVLAAADQASH